MSEKFDDLENELDKTRFNGSEGIEQDRISNSSFISDCQIDLEFSEDCEDTYKLQEMYLLPGFLSSIDEENSGWTCYEDLEKESDTVEKCRDESVDHESLEEHVGRELIGPIANPDASKSTVDLSLKEQQNGEVSREKTTDNVCRQQPIRVLPQAKQETNERRENSLVNEMVVEARGPNVVASCVLRIFSSKNSMSPMPVVPDHEKVISVMNQIISDPVHARALKALRLHLSRLVPQPSVFSFVSHCFRFPERRPRICMLSTKYSNARDIEMYIKAALEGSHADKELYRSFFRFNSRNAYSSLSELAKVVTRVYQEQKEEVTIEFTDVFGLIQKRKRPLEVIRLTAPMKEFLKRTDVNDLPANYQAHFTARRNDDPGSVVEISYYDELSEDGTRNTTVSVVHELRYGKQAMIDINAKVKQHTILVDGPMRSTSRILDRIYTMDDAFAMLRNGQIPSRREG